MEIKLIDKSNFTRDSLKGFRRYQEVKNVYRLKDGNMTLVCNPFTEDWNAARLLQKAEEILKGKYVTYCAFEKNCVVGEIMLIPQLNKGRLIIDSFHVSSDYRRRGIGRSLLEAARQEALKRGAYSLYASCCSAEETINFYSAMGFRLSSDPIPSLVKDEPYDLQMECMIFKEKDYLKNVMRDSVTSFTIRRLSEDERQTALDLAWAVFSEYESPDYPAEGTEEFRKCLHDEGYLSGLHYYGTFDGEKLIGEIAIRPDRKHICFFFVDGRYHRRGIGTRMFRRLLDDYPNETITLNSSPYGLPFYKAIGFVPTDEEKTVNGIRFTPMKYEGK